MTVVPGFPIVAPTPVSTLAPVRRFLRWSLLVGFVIGMTTWLLSYADSGRQLATIFVGFFGWFCLGCVGCVVKIVEVTTALRRRQFWLRVLPRWGSLLWLAAPMLYRFAESHALDAVVWFQQHREQLEHLLQDGARREGLSARRAEPDIDMQVVTPDVVLFWLGSRWGGRGIAHDPTGRLVAGGAGGPAGYLGRVTDLGEGWRAWSRGDGTRLATHRTPAIHGCTHPLKGHEHEPRPSCVPRAGSRHP